MSTVRHAHSSSLYDRAPQLLAKQVKRAVEAKNPSATLITFTEVGSPEREQVLYKADPDSWAAWVPEPSDVGIMWRRKQFEPRWKETHKLTDKVWTDGHGRKHETWAASAVLDHRDGMSLFISVCHLPSHVQDGDRFYDNAQARAWRDALAGWNDYWTSKRKSDRPDLGMIVADWNVDYFRGHWRRYVGGKFPGLKLGWAGNMPPQGHGTHGDRLIDATWATSQAGQCFLLRDDASSDHRPYGEIISWGKH